MCMLKSHQNNMIKCDKQMKLGDSCGTIGNNCTYLIKGKIILDAYR